MDKISQLQHRKAALEAQLEQQRADLKNTFVEIRKEIEPANLLKKAVSGALGFSKSKLGEEKMGLDRLPAPVSFLLDLLVKDPKWALGLKLISPVVLRYWRKPGKSKEPVLEVKPAAASTKTKFYGKLRSGISSLRAKLRKPEKGPEKTSETNTEQPEN